MSIWVMPLSAKASRTACTIAGGPATAPISPVPSERTKFAIVFKISFVVHDRTAQCHEKLVPTGYPHVTVTAAQKMALLRHKIRI